MNIMLLAAGGDIGGGKTHILSLARELSANNRLRLVSFRHGVLADEGREMGLDVQVIENGLHLLRDMKMLLEAVDGFSPDVIHCHGAKANMLGVLVKKLRSIPVMTTVHSDPKLDYLGTPLKQFTFGSINAIALRNMDYYMAVAGRMEQNLIQRGFDPWRIFPIYNGLDFSKAKTSPKPKKGPEEDLVVGIAARLTPIKDIGTVIRAFALAYEKNPRLKLMIAGTGEDETELRTLVKDLRINNRVEFVGWISDIQGFFAQVDINVLASLSETFPYSLLEGAYEHCPAIASRVGGIPALIKHGENGFLFEAGDVETFAGYIHRLSIDETLRRKLAENLFQTAKADFSLDRMRQDQETVYQTILRRKKRTGRQGAVICGAYGRGNAGDEAILKAILGQFREADGDMPFWIMSRNKKETRMVSKTKSMYIFNLFAFLRSLGEARIFVNGGGSLIQDVTSSRSLYFYLFTLLAAKWSGCRVILYGCGIGPIKSPLNRRIAGKVLNNTAEIITLRDSVSYEALKEMKVDKPTILLAADPTVNLDRAETPEVEAAFQSEGIPQGIRKIGFCLRNWPGFLHPSEVAKAADYAYETYGVTPVFLPIEIPKDVTAADRVTVHMKSPYYACTKRHNVEELIGMLGSMEVVVGMRLHSLIFATAGGSPVIGISYDVKVDSFMKDIGSTSCIPLMDLSAEKLCREIDFAMNNGRSTAKQAADHLRQMEKQNIQSAMDLLQPKETTQILCVSTSNYEPIPTRKQNVMNRLDDTEVLYFDPPVSFLAPLKDRNAKKRLVAYRKPGTHPKGHITVYATPPVLPFFNRYRWINRINQRRLAGYLKRRMKEKGILKPVLWCYSPTSCDLVDLVPHSGLVYDCVDRHSAYPGMIDPVVVDQMEQDLAQKADQVFCTAKGLYNTLVQYNRSTQLIPNGAAFELFSQVASLESENTNLNGPIFGFVGMLQDCIDYDCIEAVAQAFPKGEVVLVGRALPGVDLGPLERHPNIRFAGLVPQSDLPSIIATFDVCINAFRGDRLSEDVSPLKFYEYLATGKPIVSTRVPRQVEDFADVVYLADNPTDFVIKCKEALRESDEDKGADLRKRRMEYGRASSWDHRVSEMVQILEGKGIFQSRRAK